MSEQDAPLADVIEAFLAEHEMSPVTFGREALNDPHFVRDIRGEGRKRPRRVWPETEAKVREFITNYRDPDQADAA